jgi:glycerophosphoryl diester phosphodiesterase
MRFMCGSFPKAMSVSHFALYWGMPRRKVLVHGHRGARARFPENTIAGFEYAIALGVDAIEMDLILTAAGAVAISHNYVSGPLPALDEALALAPLGSFSFDLELKCYAECGPPEHLAARAIRYVRAHGLEHRVTLMSFDFRALAAARQIAPGIRLAALIENDARDFVTAATAASADRVSPKWTLVTAEKVAAAHAAGIQVVPWTANAPKQWERLIEAGVDGIITDDPAALITWLPDNFRSPR